MEYGDEDILSNLFRICYIFQIADCNIIDLVLVSIIKKPERCSITIRYLLYELRVDDDLSF